MMNPTEEILIKNWAAIIYNNNRDVNRLGYFPLTDTEMQQIMTQVDNLFIRYNQKQKCPYFVIFCIINYFCNVFERNICICVKNVLNLHQGYYTLWDLRKD